jgi:hypothetical protein
VVCHHRNLRCAFDASCCYSSHSLPKVYYRSNGKQYCSLHEYDTLKYFPVKVLVVTLGLVVSPVQIRTARFYIYQHRIMTNEKRSAFMSYTRNECAIRSHDVLSKGKVIVRLSRGYRNVAEIEAEHVARNAKNSPMIHDPSTVT